MPLWGNKDQANNAPGFKGVLAHPKVYAQTATVSLAGSVFTQGSANVTLTSTTGINVNDRVSSSNATIQAGLSTGTIVDSVVNSTVVVLSGLYTGATTTNNASFNHEFVTGFNLFSNSTPDAFQNGMAIGIFGMSDLPNFVTITANTISGNNFLTNLSANASVIYGNTTATYGANIASGSNTVQLIANVTGTVAAGVLTISANNYGPTLQIGQVITSGASGWVNSALVSNSTPLIWTLANTALAAAAGNTFTTTNLPNIVPGMQVYTTATGLANIGLAVANVVGTNVVLTNTTSTANNAAPMVFSNIAYGMVVSGNNLPVTAPNLAGVTTISGTVSNGTIGQTGNVLIVTAVSGPPILVGMELAANATLNIANGTYITSTNTGSGGLGSYNLNRSFIANGAAGIAVTIPTIVPSVVSVNSTVIALSSNAYATGGSVGNTVFFSSKEKTAFGRAVSQGWVKVKYGTGPVASFGVNTVSTSGYANGETIIISGGSANGLATITTNTGASSVGANISLVGVTFPGFGFTNTSTATLTYSRQQHIANIISVSSNSSFVNGDIITATCTFNIANTTGYIAGNVLTITNNQTGTLTIGNIIKGGATITANLINGNNWLTNLSSNAGITTGQIITSTTSGIPTTAIVTSVNATVVVMSSAFTGTGTTSASVTTAIQANTMVLNQLTGSAGGNGTYTVSNYQTVGSSAVPFNNFVSTGQIITGVATVSGTTGAVTNANFTMTNVGLFTNGLTAANLVLTYSNSIGGAGTANNTGLTGVFASASAGASANLVLGGRSGRIMTENMVAIQLKNDNPADVSIVRNN
jgi:hypothetical protein